MPHVTYYQKQHTRNTQFNKSMVPGCSCIHACMTSCSSLASAHHAGLVACVDDAAPPSLSFASSYSGTTDTHVYKYKAQSLAMTKSTSHGNTSKSPVGIMCARVCSAWVLLRRQRYTITPTPAAHSMEVSNRCHMRGLQFTHDFQLEQVIL